MTAAASGAPMTRCGAGRAAPSRARGEVRHIARSTDGSVAPRDRGHPIPPGAPSAVLGLPAGPGPAVLAARCRTTPALASARTVSDAGPGGCPTFPDAAWPRYGSRRRYRAAGAGAVSVRSGRGRQPVGRGIGPPAQTASGTMGPAVGRAAAGHGPAAGCSATVTRAGRSTPDRPAPARLAIRPHRLAAASSGRAVRHPRGRRPAPGLR